LVANGANNATSYLWENGVENHAVPYAERISALRVLIVKIWYSPIPVVLLYGVDMAMNRRHCPYASLLWLLSAFGAAMPLSAEVVINEIHHDPVPKTNAVEFIELYNTGGTSVHIAGWRFTRGIDYTFPVGTTIAATNYIVVAQDPVALNARFGVSALGPWSGKLSAQGERVTLKDAAGQVVDEVDYRRRFPWPICPNGRSMELLNPALDNDLGGSWRSSGLAGGNAMTVYVQEGASSWRYFKGRTEPSSPSNAWRQLSFVEGTNWLTGQASFGYGDDDDFTTLDDMQNNYGSVYFRKTFTVEAGAVPAHLLLRVYIDDGAIVWINGEEVARISVESGFIPHDGVALDHEACWGEIALTNAATFLAEGTNIMAVHALNVWTGSSDFSFDAKLLEAGASASEEPSPGAANTVYTTNAPPAIRQVRHSPKQPCAGQAVTVRAKITDTNGVQSVILQYQLVKPGQYLRADDEAYSTNWTSLTMSATGDVFYATLPSTLQKHRHLVRYRMAARDSPGAEALAPCPDDDKRNFAYFVYDGVPAWTGADQPGVTAPVVFSTNIMNSLPVYHLIARSDDVEKCQYDPAHDNVRFRGTLVYDGRVYDHVQFKVRGEYSTYHVGKNKWRFYFNRGTDFAARNNYGKKYDHSLRRLNLNSCSSAWVPVNRGMAGLDEAVSFRLYQLAGVLAPNTHYCLLRVIDDGAEATAEQYVGDVWGLYMALEHTDGRMLDEHGFPDGNLYKIADGVGKKRNQGPTQSADDSDWKSFSSTTTPDTPVAWWRDNYHLDSYYSFRAVNRLISNIDMRHDNNYAVYHHTNGIWYVIPQDMDMTFIPETHLPGLCEMWDCLAQPAIALEARNRCREMLDLLAGDSSPTGGQAAQVVYEMAQWVNPTNATYNVCDMDRFMWNYNPRTNPEHYGNFYRTPLQDTRFGGTWTRTLATPDIEGFMKYMVDFMTDTDPDGFAVGDGDQRGYGYNHLEQEALDADIPDTPTLTYTGDASCPANGLTFQSSAFSDTNGTFNAIAWRIAEIRNPSTPGYAVGKRWKYEVEALWDSGAVSNPAYAVTIPASVVQTGRTYRVRVRHQDSTLRWSHWSDPAAFIGGPATGVTALADLVISEIHYHPRDAEDYEFIEFYNAGSQTIPLGNVEIRDAVTFTFPAGALLSPGSYVVVVADTAAFSNRYRNPVSPYYYAGISVAGQWKKGLSNGGETITVKSPGGTVLYSFDYDDAGAWPERADGRGSSLSIVNPSSVPGDVTSKSAWLGQGTHWRSSCLNHGSPGRADVAVDTLRINEIMAHSDTGSDWIEIANTGTVAVSSADLYLSDDWTNLQKFALSSAVADLPGSSYTTFGQTVLGFGFSELGDEAILARVAAGGRVTFIDSVDFGSSGQDVPIGLYTRSDGDTDFVAQYQPTKSGRNTYPRVGPVVISEIMYHPTNDIEYVELCNISDVPVALYDTNYPANTWKLTSAVDYAFPTGQSITAAGAIVISSTTESAFRSVCAVAPSTPVYGPWQGKLDNAGEAIRLKRPGRPEATGFVPYILVDKVDYFPSSPWPIGAAGTGNAIERITLYAYGNDPANWRATGPAPGTVANRQEHLAFLSISAATNPLLRWSVIPNERYLLEYADGLRRSNWTTLQILSPNTNAARLLDTTPQATNQTRFYRVKWLYR